MPAWTTISNALVAVGAKPFATTIQALRDNPEAIAEGATGAPRIQLPALIELVAGSTVRLRDDATKSTSSSTFQIAASWGVIQTGQQSVSFEHRLVSGASVEARIVRVRAGTLTTVQTYTTSSGSFVARSFDVDVIPGDLIRVDYRGPSSNTTEIRNIRMSTDSATAPYPIDNFGAWENLP